MNSEELLKSISNKIKKHKDFLNDNPDIFHIIEDRLYKAVDDEYDYEDQFGDEEYNDMFDDEPKSDDEAFSDNVEYQDIDSEDDADKWLASQGLESEDHKEESKPSTEEEKPRKMSSSGYRDWQPKDKYEDHHQEAIDGHMGDGWSHREAERLVGQHEKGGDPRQSKIRPSEPSAKMFESVKGQAGEYLKNYERKISENADARKNPVKFANAQNRKAHEAVHSDFNDAFAEFKNSDDVKDLRGRDRHNAIKGFKTKWHEDNPEHRDNTINVAGDTAGSYDKAKEVREDHIHEGEKALIQAGMKGTGSASGEFSAAAAGGEDTTRQGALQSVGGQQGESGGYSANITKDPSLHIAEQHPEFVASLKEKHAKLNEAMNHPSHTERKERLAGIKIKKGSQ